MVGDARVCRATALHVGGLCNVFFNPLSMLIIVAGQSRVPELQ